jgi:cobalamin biosynthesis protein CobD/CbiB
VLAITLAEAKNIAVGLVIVFVVGAIAAAWIMKTIMQKVAVALVLGILAFAVWTQRTSLQDCADKVVDAYELDGVNPTIIDTDCSFFGTTITISDPRTVPDDLPDTPE